MSTVSVERPENIILPHGTPETLITPGSATTDEPRTTIKVPSCRPTPLIGSWADESWPLNSRQASEIITEQVLTKQRSSIVFEDEDGNVTFGEATEFYPSSHHDRSPSSVDDEETVNESLMQEAMSHAQVSSEEVQSCTHTETESPTHVAQSFMFNPYDIHESRAVLSRCTCDVCAPMLMQKQGSSTTSSRQVFEETDDDEEEVVVVQQGMMEISEFDSVSHQVTPSVPQTIDQYSTDYPVYHQNQNQDHHDDWDLPTYNHKISPSMAQAPIGHHVPQQDSNSTSAAPFPGGAGSGFLTHTQISSPPFMEQNTPQPSPGQMNATPGSTVSGLSHPPPTQRRFIPETERPSPQPREISKFMPPPPPPRISTLVFEEEGSVKNPSGVYYHLVMRWYSKVLESQEYFVTSESRCPAPNKERFSFEQWCDEISGWWYTHFENLQKKAPRFPPRRR